MQDVLAADNPNGFVTDLNGTDHGADVGLPTVDIAVFQLICHQSRKHVYLFCVDDANELGPVPPWPFRAPI
jgi:hypothetical protein